MTLPNFFVLGAPKCGTTSLYHFLRQHPQVYVSPRKEPFFFAYEGDSGGFDTSLPRRYHPVTTREEYEALFSAARGEVAVGEASTLYLGSARAARNIRALVPEARLIAVLRDPVERAYSAWQMRVREGVEELGVEEAFARCLAHADADADADDAGPDSVRREHYIRVGLYRASLERYRALFPRDRLRVCLYDDLRSDPARFAAETYAFLGVDARFAPRLDRRHNVGGLPRRGRLYDFLNRRERLRAWVPKRLTTAVQRHLLRAPPPLPEALRERLGAVFRDDVLWLQDDLGRDLSHWLRAGAGRVEPSETPP